MSFLKKLKIILPILLLSTFVEHKAKATEECFEGVSRSIFKFNMAFDDTILEPIAKGYNKLPDPIKKIVVTIPLNTASEPIVVSSGVIVLMVCNRSGGKITKDTRDQVRRMLLMKRAELLERSMLRDIQRSAFLEIRR